MPVAVGAVLSAVAGGFSITAAGTLAFSLTLGSFLTNTAIGLVLGYASSALAPKPKGGGGSNFARESAGLTQSIREPVTSHRIIYGQTRAGGPLAFIGMTEENKYLHMVICLAAHEVESIDEVWLNDYSIATDHLDADGFVTTGRFDGKVKIRKHHGAPGQAADSVMVAQIAGWTNNHRLREIAYLYLRLEYDQDKFPGGVPNITAFVKGKKLYDPRIDDTKFHTNAVLFQRDYIYNPVYGFNDGPKIEDTVASASANIADEYVTVLDKAYTVASVDDATDIFTMSGTALSLQLGDRVTASSSGSLPTGISAATNYYVIPYQFKDTPRIKLATSLDNALAGVAINLTSAGTGTITITKNAEPRYHGGGIIDTENTLEDNINELLTATGGRAFWTGGKWIIKAAAYDTPTITLDEGDIIEAITMRTKLQKRDKFNGVKGIYRSPINLEIPSDYPALFSNAYAEIDGEDVYREMNFPFTQRPETARRIAKIEFLKARQEITARIVCKLPAMRLQNGDTVKINNTRFGWSEKVFEVTKLTFVPAQNGTALAVALDLRETASAVFDWSTSEESTIDPAPNTTLPNAFDVAAPTGLAFDSFPVDTLAGDTLFRIVLSWDTHPDFFVVNGGGFEIQYKLSADTNYRPSFFVIGSLIESEIVQGAPNVSYDLRIRAVNNIGVRSEWQPLTGVISGSAGGITFSENYGAFVSDSVTASDDYGAFVSDAVTSSDEYGGFI